MADESLRESILAAECAVAEFISHAATEIDPKMAADWALAAKNMAAAVHSLIGALQTARRS